MKSDKFPKTAEEFNKNINDGLYLENNFWTDYYNIPDAFSEMCGPYTKNNKTYYLYSINNYIVIILFSHLKKTNYVFMNMKNESESKSAFFRTHKVENKSQAQFNKSYSKERKLTKQDEVNNGVQWGYLGEIEKIYAESSALDFIRENYKEYWTRSVNSNLYNHYDKIQKRIKYHRCENYIIVDTPFENLLDVISEYFMKIGLYPINDDDRVIMDKGLKEIWNYSTHDMEPFFYSPLYPSSDATNMMDLEVGVSLYNTHNYLVNWGIGSDFDWDKKLREDFTSDHSHAGFPPIPDIVFEKCREVPHILKISYSINEFNSILDEGILMELGLKFGDKAFLITPDLNIRGFKSNRHIPNNEKAYFIYEYTNNYFSSLNLENAALDISIEIKLWHLLHENSKKFMSTGYFLYKHTISGSEHLLDYSHAALAFSKCVENEMVQRIVIPFKEYYDLNFGSEDISSDLNDFNLKRMALYLIGRTTTPPEMGSFAYFLNQVITSKSRAKKSVSIRSFKEFCSKLTNPDFILDKNEMWNMLNQISKKYRNGSAHIKVLPKETLIEFYNILIPKGFLNKFIHSTILKKE